MNLTCPAGYLETRSWSDVHEERASPPLSGRETAYGKMETIGEGRARVVFDKHVNTVALEVCFRAEFQVSAERGPELSGGGGWSDHQSAPDSPSSNRRTCGAAAVARRSAATATRMDSLACMLGGARDGAC